MKRRESIEISSGMTKNFTTTKPHDEMRILLTDDNPRVLDSLQSLLAINGFKADTALGGAAAIEKLRQTHIDIILLDLKMPGIDGFQVMTHIADNKQKTIAIVVSGESAFGDISKAIRLGAYDYLRKPYEPVELITTLKNAIKRTSMEGAHEAMRIKLDRSEKLHRFVVNNSPDIIFMLDESGNINFLNTKVEELLGYKCSDLIGMHITSMIDDDIEKAKVFFDKDIDHNESSETIQVTLKSRFADKTKRHFEITLCAISNQDQSEQVDGAGFQRFGTARDISGRVEAEAFINFQAYHDLLTRLPNRSLFKDRLSNSITQAQRQKTRLAVMFIDLDRFKVINDSLGHTMGDRLLQAVSNRLLQNIRKSDTLSRFGGDEFTLLLPKVEDKNAAAQVAEKILNAMKLPFSLGGRDIHVGASIGIAMYPESATTMDALIKNSDIAMYRVKRTDKDGYQFFSPEMSSSATKRLLLEQDMRKAIEDDEFEVFYQPQVSIKGRSIYGVEALIRWNHPTLGRLLPSDFIGIAEDSRLIVELDKQTLQRACKEVRQLQNGRMPNLRLAVNLSPIVLEKSDFIDAIFDILSEEDFPPEFLELEITENLLMNDRPDIYENFRRLTDHGIKLAIDDFGTGYSSLSYLQKFPIATLKIDRSFISNIKSGENEACIVKSIMSMAQNLKMFIIAEGVENNMQLEYLKSLGCTVVQGYIFGTAASLKDVVRDLSDELAVVFHNERVA
jgi:diguanylate cyclase (GGDEF)-like protein/PAS domain S-box-containing protein